MELGALIAEAKIIAILILSGRQGTEVLYGLRHSLYITQPISPVLLPAAAQKNTYASIETDCNCKNLLGGAGYHL